MDKKQFKLWNLICAGVATLVAAVTYLLTIEPTASFWDCGEFIASSYKLEVGHPPGNPVFQLFARFFSMFGGSAHAAVAINAMNAILSALTIGLLYLTIVFFAKRLLRKNEDEDYTVGRAIAIFGSGLVGSLAYCFSDTFWFSAVEGEVYAMSSFLTALVVWAMTKWYEQADQPHSNRWIVLICFIMGLSIGVHLLNLLAIPTIVYLYYYRKHENEAIEYWKLLLLLGISAVIVAIILFVMVPGIPKAAALYDRFFVNVLGCPYNTGAIIFMLLLLGSCFGLLFWSQKTKRVLINTITLCFTTIVIGFSLFSIVIIRSSVKTPTNEYQPDNPYTLVRYLGREQYGSNPLLYGQCYDAPFEIETPKYWAALNGEYVESDGQMNYKFYKEGKMFFPRMWAASGDGRNEEFYEDYVGNDYIREYAMSEDGDPLVFKKPKQIANLKFFWGYQVNWMYWRYFMWNFAGRQNDIHSPSPGDRLIGNWECGIDLIDQIHIGDQSNIPDYLKNNKGKNHYFLLPLLLGIIGIFFQTWHDSRGSWLVFLLFVMTGIAIVVYLNQPPFQVRERDYAYAGSFYAFSIWIGFAVAAIYSLGERILKDSGKLGKWSGAAIATISSVLLLGVPTLMAQQNWDDHDRSNRYTAVEMAKNYLNSVGKNGILITHGDNDTFPLWYAQEVEGVRTDVRICNTSLLGTDWHIDQMKYACNNSAPLDLRVGPEQYLYGTNDAVYILDINAEKGIDYIPTLWEVMNYFKNPTKKYPLVSGRMVNIINSRKFRIPVNKENVIKYGILDAKYEDQIPDEIVLQLPSKKNYLTKPELFMLDLLSNYQWDRPLSLLSMGGDLEVGIKDYLMYDGFSFRFVPLRHPGMRQSDIKFADPDDLYYKMMNVYKWDCLKRTDYFVDYQNLYTFCGVLSQRRIFSNAAEEMLKDERPDRALELLDKCQECVPEENFPLFMEYLELGNERDVVELIRKYLETAYMAKVLDYDESFCEDAVQKGLDLGDRFYEAAKKSIAAFLAMGREEDAENQVNYVAYLIDSYDKLGYPDKADEIYNDISASLVRATTIMTIPKTRTRSTPPGKSRKEPQSIRLNPSPTIRPTSQGGNKRE